MLFKKGSGALKDYSNKELTFLGVEGDEVALSKCIK